MEDRKNKSSKWTGISKNPIGNRTLAQSYAALPARTRLYLSAGVCAFAIAGLVVSDLLEKNVSAELGTLTPSA